MFGPEEIFSPRHTAECAEETRLGALSVELSPEAAAHVQIANDVVREAARDGQQNSLWCLGVLMIGSAVQDNIEKITTDEMWQKVILETAENGSALIAVAATVVGATTIVAKSFSVAYHETAAWWLQRKYLKSQPTAYTYVPIREAYPAYANLSADQQTG